MTARQNGKTSSIKMVCNGAGNGNRIEYIGAATVETRHGTSLQPKSTTTNPFNFGDQMEYVGYATINGTEYESARISQMQGASQTFGLVFDISQNQQDGYPCPGMPTLTDVDGNVYNTVLIGSQCWMKENLRTTRYADNTPIPAGDTYNETNPYRYAPNNDEATVATYGYLYNWPAVMHGAASSVTNPSNVQGICPTGWHVPSLAEWTQLTDYVGSQSQYVVCGSNSSYIAKALAAATGWYEYDNECAVGYNQSENNATGFSTLPSGFYIRGIYYSFGYVAFFWSSTATNDELYADDRSLSYDSAIVSWYYDNWDYGYSVRCVKD